MKKSNTQVSEFPLCQSVEDHLKDLKSVLCSFDISTTMLTSFSRLAKDEGIGGDLGIMAKFPGLFMAESLIDLQVKIGALELTLENMQKKNNVVELRPVAVEAVDPSSLKERLYENEKSKEGQT